MLFVDDSYLFCKADLIEASTVLEILETYERASGQQVNRSKSSIFYSTNVLDYNKQPIGQILKMSEASMHSTYLGLPNIVGRNKSAMLGYLKDKANTKIRSWNVNHVSRADFFHATAGHNPSFIWRSLLEAKQLLRDGTRWRIGDGTIIQILDQPWLLSNDCPYITSSPDPLHNKMVDSLMCLNEKSWDMEVLSDVLNERDQSYVLDIPLSESNHSDTWFWLHEDSGIYSVKSAYKFLQSQKRSWNVNENDRIWQVLWKIKAPPKSLNLVWRALSNCLPTLVQLQMKRVQVQAICPQCQGEPQTTLHALVQCPFASQCWSIMFPSVQVNVSSCFNSWLVTLLSSVNARVQAKIITLCWVIWRARNDRVWNQKSSSANKTVAAARQYLTQWTETQCRSFVTPLQPYVEGDGASKWVKHQSNKVKVSVDAIVFEEWGGVGFGMIARDSRGSWLKLERYFTLGWFLR
ncbi:uncharacterized protein LOC141692156 [Apium graveolens]|uniref:uncharacterized protein LOC141692156 n=1 Tax=Apium graveolens TaxID=4045 RepID=UPI003D7A3B0E